MPDMPKLPYGTSRLTATLRPKPMTDEAIAQRVAAVMPRGVHALRIPVQLNLPGEAAALLQPRRTAPTRPRAEEPGADEQPAPEQDHRAPLRPPVPALFRTR